MKIVGVVGEPAAGKSTLMRQFIDTLGEGDVHKEGLVVFTVFPDDLVAIAGSYEEGKTFSGTDSLSKACGPQYREWIKEKDGDPAWDDIVFYWEGERFSNNKMLEFLSNEVSESTVYYLEAEPDVLDSRNAARSGQNETWRKGMRTRLKNLRDRYPMTVVSSDFTL